MAHNSSNTITSLVTQCMEQPFFAFRPTSLQRAACYFQQHFDATCLYAVKTNPDMCVLRHLYAMGMRHFDVASLEETCRIHTHFPDATLFFMHPVKSRHTIRKAYFHYGVRHFSLDCHEELQKILEETCYATDLCLHVRLAIPNTYAELTLADKFGVSLQDAPALIADVAAASQKVGVCFHTGSQCMHPDAYRIAIRMAGQVVQQSGATIHYFNVGGGFPSIYPGMIPPELKQYFSAIHQEYAKLDLGSSVQLLAEPGRALVAECMSLIVRVELRKGNMLYINDGTYGSLFDAGTPRFIFPAKVICEEEVYSTDLAAFSFYGPTCDSLDYMKGPFYLPNDIAEGDFIEIGQMGAYGRTMATAFNGFSPSDILHTVTDKPLMTMYGDGEEISDEAFEVIAA